MPTCFYPLSDIQTPRILTELSKSGGLRGANGQIITGFVIYQSCGQLADPALGKIHSLAKSLINTRF
jgi:hypothetical protein